MSVVQRLEKLVCMVNKFHIPAIVFAEFCQQVCIQRKCFGNFYGSVAINGIIFMNQSQDGSGNRECNGNQGQDNTDPKANPIVTAKVLDEVGKSMMDERTQCQNIF